jgi:NitT/TauT family transport system substrate-binding protein
MLPLLMRDLPTSRLTAKMGRYAYRPEWANNDYKGGRVLRTVVIGVGLLLSAVHTLAAAEIVKVAVPDRGEWDTSFTQFGLQQGFFQQKGLAVEIVRVANEASLEKAVISGNADIGVAARFPDILAAWLKGAPIKIISSEATGAPDIFWFSRAGGPIRRMEDLHGQPVGYGEPASLSYFVLTTLLKQAGVNDARLVPTGTADNGIPMVFGAQLAASWGGPLAAAKDLLAGEVSLIARGNDSPLVRGQTTRVNVANAKFIAHHRSDVLGFLEAYKKSVDWAYSTPVALEAYARLSDQSMEFVKYIVREFASKASNHLNGIKGEDRVLEEARAIGHLPRVLHHDDIKGAYDLILKDA